jgi:hypothetical protein
VECDLYMKILKGFTIGKGNNKMHVLKLVQNLYGQKQAGRIWNKHLHHILLVLGWVQSKVEIVSIIKETYYFWFMLMMVS